MPLPVGGEDPVGNPESAIHIHNALAGQNGPILRSLGVSDNGDGSGRFEGRFTLTDEEVADLRADALYVNLHTEANPSGEIRGQLAVDAALTDIVTAGLPMSEDQQVGTVPADGPSTGEIRATLDAETLTLTVEGSFSGLTSPLLQVGGEDPAGNPESAVHIHFAPAGENGPIFRNLAVSDNGDGSGSFSGSFVLESEAVARAFAADQYYVNLHTEANPSGELRGQIDLESGRFDDVTTGIPMSEDQQVADVPVVDTDATGSYDVSFDSETRLFTIEGRFEDLSGPLLPIGGEDAFGNPESAVHLHIGEAGENGPILINLAVTDNGDGSGTFSGSLIVPEDRVAEFDANAYYVNLHTETNPGGELRGQLALSSAIRDRTVQREEIAGTSGDDALAGTEGNDVIRGLPGDDLIADSAGDDLVDGGAGFDTIELVSGSADVTAEIGTDGETVLEGGAGQLTLVNTEAVALGDGTLRLDVGAGAAAGVVARLYEGVLGRAGEASGLEFWIDGADAGVEAVAIAAAFLASEEFDARFGADLSDEAFLDALYQNLRDGPGNESGLDFWRDALDRGADRADIALAFAESAEALDNTAGALSGGLFLEDAIG